MSPKHLPTVTLDADDVKFVHCTHGCPQFGQEYGAKLYGVTCKCGNREVACKYCVDAGRITECGECVYVRRHDPSSLN